MERRHCFVFFRAREGCLRLAGHVLCRRVSQEISRIRGRVWGNIEHLVFRHAGRGVCDDVANCISARLSRREPNISDHAHQIGSFIQRDVVELHVFACGQVTLLQRRVFFGDFAEDFQLPRGQTTKGSFDANHLLVGLPLSVDALSQPESHKRRFFEITSSETFFLRFEIGDFFAADQQHPLSCGIGCPFGLFGGYGRGHGLFALTNACAPAPLYADLV